MNGEPAVEPDLQAVPADAQLEAPPEPAEAAPASCAEEPNGDEVPPPGPGRGIWSKQRLRRRIVRERLVTGGDGGSLFKEARLEAAAYRLTMGPEVYVSPSAASTRLTVRDLKEREAFFIPPGQFAFLLSEEVVEVPGDALAFIALRSKGTKFRGLVNVSGFHADPGYHGRLIFAVFNAGPGDVHLRRGDELFAIFFADLDERSEKPRDHGEGFMSIPADLISPLAGEIQSFAGLDQKIDEVTDDMEERLKKLEQDSAIVRWATALILGALITLLVRTMLEAPADGRSVGGGNRTEVRR